MASITGATWRREAVRDPYRDSDIVLARDADRVDTDLLRSQAPDREIIYLIDGEFTHDLPFPAS